MKISGDIRTQQARVLYHTLVLKESCLHVDKTGAGKSLAYTIANKFNSEVLGNTGKDLVVVVEPTNILCHDAARQLRDANLGDVVLLAGALSDDASAPTTFRDITTEQLTNAKFIVIVSEMFDIALRETDHCAVATFVSELRSNRVSRLLLFVIDEAHLCASWASFRPAMMTVLTIARALTSVSKLLLSATITDCTASLLEHVNSSNNKMYREIGDIRRADLAPHLIVRSDDHARDYCEIAKHISVCKSDETIVIVCARFRQMEALILYLESLPDTYAKMLDSNVCFRFHGATSEEEKARVVARLDQQRHQPHRINVLIASSSFNHGVNLKPSGGLTVYAIGCFDTVAMLLQALGRASRDGAGANVYWFVRAKDFAFVIRSNDAEADRLLALSKRSTSASADEQRLLVLRRAAVMRDSEQLRALGTAVGSVIDSTNVVRANRRCVMQMLLAGFLSSPTIDKDAHCDATCKCETRVVERLQPRVADGTVAMYLDALVDARRQLFNDAQRQRVLYGIETLAPTSTLLRIASECALHSEWRIDSNEREALPSLATVFDNARAALPAPAAAPTQNATALATSSAALAVIAATDIQCHCKKPRTATDVQCESCKKWLHTACMYQNVNVVMLCSACLGVAQQRRTKQRRVGRDD